MIGSGIDVRVKIQDVLSSQLPSFVLSEAPLTDDFLKQFYVSQEFQGGAVDFVSNLDQYLDLNNLSSEALYGSFELTEDVAIDDTVIHVNTTKSFPNEWGLLKVDDEIMTYTGVTTNTFTGVVRGFSGITSYHAEANPQDLVFNQTEAAAHTKDTEVQNLSTLFLKEFYNKLAFTFAPGFENLDLDSDLDVGNWIRQVRTFFQTKGSEESIKILFKVLYGEKPTVVDLEKFLIKPSEAEFSRRDYAVGLPVSGNPIDLRGRTVFQSDASDVFGAISEIEAFTREGRLFYRIFFFVSNDEIENERKLFTIPGRTYAQRGWKQGDTTLTVDTTIGFRDNNEFITADGTVFKYEERTVNQFLGVTCEDPEKEISTKDEIIDGITVVGISESGEEIVLRLTGVLSNIKFDGEVPFSFIGEKIRVESVGESIRSQIATRKEVELPQIIANSFIYNTSVRFQVKEFNGATFDIAVPYLDKSSIQVGDRVDILQRGSQVVYVEARLVTDVQFDIATITVDDSFGIPLDQPLDIRRNQKYANSSGTPIDYGNDAILTNVLNLYDATRFDSNFYVATNSLPSYEITANIVESTITNPVPGNFEDFNSFVDKYATLVFTEEVEFYTGDLVTYSISDKDLTPLLTPGEYYVEVLADRRKVRLYVSPSFIGSDNFAGISANFEAGSHFFTLESQKTRQITTKRTFRKIPVERSLASIDRLPQPTVPGVVAVLTNGVEIISYQSPNKVYLGPIKELNAVSGGEGYSVTVPPEIVVSEPNVQISDGSAPPVTPSLAKGTPVIKGKLEKIYIDPQDFDIDQVFSIQVKGGNSSGATAKPIIERKNRSITFDTRVTAIGGGINPSEDSILFQFDHNLPLGERVIYNNRGFESIGVAAPGSDISLGKTLANGGIYFAKPINNKTIQLYTTLEALKTGGAPVGLSSNLTGFGVQSFDTLSKNKIIGATIVEDGGFFYYRKMNFSPSNVFIEYDEIRYDNHGFSSGEYINYETTGTNVGGLSTSNQYIVTKLDDNTLKLSDAGVGGTITSNYERELFVDLTSTGIGTHSFQYPEITTEVLVSFGSSITGSVVATPVIRGEINQVYTDDGGYYGSDIIGFQKNPDVDIIIGEGARIKPVVVDGKIISVQILSKGKNYSDTPDLVVTDSSESGAGALLRAVVIDGEIEEVIIIEQGISYGETTTDITVVEPAKDAIIIPRIRDLTINLNSRFGFEVLSDNNYRIASYSRTIREDVYEDLGQDHSPIIGWANDGNPIYGGFGLSDPEDINSGFRAMKTAYDLDAEALFGRPSLAVYPAGFFVEDFVYTDNGDLDKYNGRYCRTPEFPNGVYAYFAGISTDIQSLEREPQFPYFIGPEYRDSPINPNVTNLDQDFDLTDKPILRNTFPYYVGSPFAGSEFIDQSYLFDVQDSIIEEIKPGKVDSITIVGAGVSYAVGDVPVFDRSDDNVTSVVSEIVGKEIVDITESTLSYSKLDTKVIRLNDTKVRVYVFPSHEYLENDSVIFSGLSTSAFSLSGSHVIKLDNSGMTLYAPVPPSLTERAQDIFVNTITPNVSVGSSIKIGIGNTVETVEVLNIFPINKALRVYRPLGFPTEAAVGTPVNVITDFFDIDSRVGEFESELNTIYNFNPKVVIGTGSEPGEAVDKVYSIGNINYDISIPTQSIYAPSHGFKNLEEVIFSIPAGSPPINVNDGNGQFTIPGIGQTETLYVSSFNTDYIGLRTDPSGNDLFFLTDGGIGSGDFRYQIRSNRFAERVNLDRIRANVVTRDPHQLKSNDTVNISAVPFGPSGVGTNPAVIVQFDELSESLIIDPKFAQPSDVDVSDNLIFIENHKYILGDYLLYENQGTPITGLTTHRKYFVIPFDSDRFYLAETFVDIKFGSEKIIDLTNAGVGTHKFSKVNPQINITKNHDVEFDISDPSLFGRTLDFFYDQELTEIFESNSIDPNFIVTGVSTEGYPDATKTITFSPNNPNVIYYGIESGGYISTTDTNVIAYNSIQFIDSVYSDKRKVTVEDNNTFSISLPIKPEVSSYNSLNCDLNYTTSSRNALGGIARVNILSSGQNFDAVPEFITVESTFGNNSSLRAESNDIGRLSSFRIQNPGWGYNADTTLNPQGVIQPTIEFTDSDFVTSIEVLDGGSGYQSAPEGVLLDSITREVITTGSVEVEIQTSTIVSVDVQVAPSGLSKNAHEFYTINNSNGIPILNIDFLDVANNTGIVTFAIQTPISGYSEPPFEVGDEVFVENIVAIPGEKANMDSADYGYRFLPVVDVVDANPSIIVSVQYPDAAIGQIGAAVTFQNAFSSLVNKKIYPQFKVNQATAVFIVGERLSLIEQDGSSLETDLVVEESNTNYFKVRGNFDILLGDSLRGGISGVIARVTSIDGSTCRFDIDSVSRLTTGWTDNIGFLDEEFQVTPDNDYYQNLSYSIKSTITFDELIGPVNRLVHPAGLKNFADTKIESVGKVGFGTTAISTDDSIILDFLGLTDVAETPLRVDRINVFDLGYDANVNNNRSNAIRLNSKTPNKRLSDFIEVKTNRVLMVDDVSNEFIDPDNIQGQPEYINFPVVTDVYTSGMIQIRNPFTDEVQLTEIIALTVDNNAFTLQKATVFDGDVSHGEFSVIALDSTEYELRFTPTNTETFDIDAKLLTQKFEVNDADPQFIGFARLGGEKNNLAPQSTDELFTAITSTVDALCVQVYVLDNQLKPYYYEIYVVVDGNDTYKAIYDFDGTPTTSYNNPICDFEVDLENGAVVINITNNTNDLIVYDTKTTEFLPNVIDPDNVNPYRFKPEKIADGQERGLNYLSTKVFGTTQDNFIEMVTLDAELFQTTKVLAYLKVPGYNGIYQLMAANSDGSTYVNVYPFLTQDDDGPQSGIGTFGAEISGNNWTVNFYPDGGISENVEITTYVEAFYRAYDSINYEPDPLVYQNNEERYYLSQYIAPLGDRTNRVRFPLDYEGTPIYQKNFQPRVAINTSTSVFTINNHFFSPSEELYYEPADSVEGAPFEAIDIAPTVISGVSTTKLPETVYAIKLDLSRFRLAATKQDADNFNFINITGIGTGNDHRLGMAKKLEKSLITIDGVVQSPLANANRTFTLTQPATAETTFLTLSGIGSIRAGDLLLADEEYVLIENIGLGTSPDGPITNTGSFPLIEVERNAVGTIGTSYSIGQELDLYRGTYNIVESDIVFTEAPNGRGDQTINESNLVELNSTFQGRVFLQQQYDEIRVFDDLSDQFDGIQNRFNVTSNGIASAKIENGGGVLVINDIYQTPTTENNQGNNYFFTDAQQAFVFEWSNNPNNANPGTGQFRFNSTDTLTVTSMGFANIDFDGLNRETYWSTLNPGERYVVTGRIGNDEIFQFEGENTDPILSPSPQIRLDNGGIISGDLPTNLQVGLAIDLLVTPVSSQSQVVFTGITSANGQRTVSEFDVNQNQIPRGGLIVSLGSTPGLGYAPLFDASIQAEVVGGSIVGIFTSNQIGVTTAVKWADYNNETGEVVVTAYGPSLTAPQTVSDAQYFNDSGRLLVTSSASLAGLGMSTGDIVVLDGLEFNCSSSTTLANVTAATYDNATGILNVTTDVPNGAAVNSSMRLENLTFSCAFGTDVYPRAGVEGNDFVVVNVNSPTEFEVNVGVSTLTHTYQSGGTTKNNVVGVIGATYDNVTGLLRVTTDGPNGAAVSSSIRLENLTFSCAFGTDVYPRPSVEGTDFIVSNVINPNTFDVNVGVSTLAHTYQSGGTASVGITTTVYPNENNAFIVESVISDDLFSVTVGTSVIDHVYVSGGTFQIVEPFQFGNQGLNPTFGYLDSLEFACPSGQTAGLTTTLFPFDTDNVPLVFRDDNAHWRFQVGVSTLVHLYVGGGTIGQITKNNPGSGYNTEVPVNVVEEGHTGDPAIIRGVPGPGGELSFVIDDPGTGYVDPYVNVPSPSYANLPVTGVFRRDIGLTTATGENLFITCEVGGATTTAIGRSEFFEVKNWEISNQGYGFLEGDRITVVGLVTDKNLTQPIEQFELTVLRTFTDNFGYWNYGEQDYIDSIKDLQDGVRQRFPLIYNGQQLSFEKNLADEDSAAIDLQAILLIYVNNVLQLPDVNYTFEGGTSFEFTRAPQPQDEIDVYFYRGKRGIDSNIVTDVSESIRPGDQVQIKKNDAFPDNKTQNIRTVTEIASSDTIRTDIYFGDDDIDTITPRPVSWDKQKRDIFIYGQPAYKTRDSLESQIRPSASILQRELNRLDSTIYVDNAELFVYEDDVDGSDITLASLDGRIYGQDDIFRDWNPLTGNPGFREAKPKAVVNALGQITGISFDTQADKGSGYPDGTQITIGAPAFDGGVRAKISILSFSSIDGSIQNAIVFPQDSGSGYDPTNPPMVFVEPPSIRYENKVIVNANNVEGFTGIITGIQGASRLGYNELTFFYEKNPDQTDLITALTPGDYIVVTETNVGNGIEAITGTSGGNPNSIIGIGTQFLDCVYRVANNIPVAQQSGRFIVNTSLNNNVSGINISGANLGSFSWGKLNAVVRDIDESIIFRTYDPTYTEDMRNFPTITRTSAGLRDKGTIAKVV